VKSSEAEGVGGEKPKIQKLVRGGNWFEKSIFSVKI